MKPMLKEDSKTTKDLVKTRAKDIFDDFNNNKISNIEANERTKKLLSEVEMIKRLEYPLSDTEKEEYAAIEIAINELAKQYLQH